MKFVAKTSAEELFFTYYITTNPMNQEPRTKNQQLPKVSIIIIDYKDNNPYLIECLDAIQKQTYKNFEIVLVHDLQIKMKYPKLRMKSLGRYVGPAEKRDIGAKMAKGEIVAFIDDDAYPHQGWLKNMIKNFEKKNVVGVGGPGVTPPHVSWKEEASGWASASPLGSGQYIYRFLPEKRRFVDDFPSMNLAVRRKEFLAVGGFDSNYWPGEDTKLCLDLVTKTKGKIIYNPKVLVYHHRRPILKAHLRQNGNFGLHRGFFVRILPKTSLRPIYFAPSALLLLTLLIPVILFLSQEFESLKYLYHIPYTIYHIYFSLLLLNSLWIFIYKLRTKNQELITLLVQPLLSIPVIFITHLWYGVRFLQGLLFTDKLKQ